MMYCPENPEVKALWEKVYPFFGPEDYGFTMENYGHDGVTSREGEGMGEFTIYDWGNGAASEARNRIFDHYGDVYVDRRSAESFGISGIAVTRRGAATEVRNLSHAGQQLRVVYDDGASGDVFVEEVATVE